MMAGPVISFPADVLRSSGLEILGSGPGTIPPAEITGAIPGFMALAAVGDLPIQLDEVPLLTSSRPSVAAAAGGSSSSPDHRPESGACRGASGRQSAMGLNRRTERGI
jgi:hypothetical protein